MSNSTVCPTTPFESLGVSFAYSLVGTSYVPAVVDEFVNFTLYES